MRLLILIVGVVLHLNMIAPVEKLWKTPNFLWKTCGKFGPGSQRRPGVCCDYYDYFYTLSFAHL